MTTQEQEKLIKKAYAKGFITQAVITGDKSEQEAAVMYKKAEIVANKIRAKHNKIIDTILKSK